MIKEVELKLTTAENLQWADLVNLLAVEVINDSHSQELLDARYYDTPCGGLAKGGMVYRVRFEAGKWLGTIKRGGSGEGGLHEREEWQVEQIDGKPNLKAFEKTALVAALTELAAEPLNLLLKTVFYRDKCLIKYRDGSVLELALDKGKIIAGQRELPINEIEIELKTGSLQSVLETGFLLAKKVPLLLEPTSKFARGLLLLGRNLKEEKRLVIDSYDDPKAGMIKLLCRQLFLIMSAHKKLMEQHLLEADSLKVFYKQVLILKALLSFSSSVINNVIYIQMQKWAELLETAAVEVITIDEGVSRSREAKRFISNFEGKFELDNFWREKRKSKVQEVERTFTPQKFTPDAIKFWCDLMEQLNESSGLENLRSFAVTRLGQMLDELYKLSQEVNEVDLALWNRVGVTLRELLLVMEAVPDLFEPEVKKLQKKLQFVRNSLEEYCNQDKMIHYLQEVAKENENVVLLYEWQSEVAERTQKQVFEQLKDVNLILTQWGDD